LWSLRPALLAYVLAVQLAALASTFVLVSAHHIGQRDLVLLAVLIAGGVLKEEMTRHVERMRRRFSDTPHQNMTSVWTLAGALVLPPGLVAVVVATLYAYLWLRTWHPVRSVRVWKLVFSVSAVTISCYTATGIRQLIEPGALADGGLQTVAWLVVAIVAYSVVNLGLVAGAIALMTTERTARRLLGTLDDGVLEYATLALGAIAAILLVHTPWVVVLLVPVLYALHRIVLIRQLEEAASTDSKTGVLNATAWQTLARREFERALRDRTGFGILMLDLDHFKHINDSHGYAVGDRVLVAVAECLAREVRDYDLLGRFRGEEFMILCPELDAADLAGVGERVRGAVEALVVPVGETGDATIRLTISVGAAHFPETGNDLEDVLLAADNALFAAKDSGRNRVEVLGLTANQHVVQDSTGDSSP
jgi:diguanylate cyclase (GGDEF)-like protein